ncbi:MAG TPA: hypothetical protein VGJ18_19310 [Gemmatimonadaceae bacterium]
MRLLIFSFLVTLSRPLDAQKVSKPLSAAESTTYLQLRDRVLTGDTAADFTALRLLYARLPDEGKPSPSAVFDRARAAPDSLAARAILDSLVSAYVGHVRAQRDVGKIYELRGDSTCARRQAAIVRAFVRSIANTDGLTPETAMLVTNIAEEYAVMESRGVKVTMQALLRGSTSRGEESFDLLTGADSSGKSIELYFRLNWW